MDDVFISRRTEDGLVGMARDLLSRLPECGLAAALTAAAAEDAVFKIERSW